MAADGDELTYVGHATVLAELADARLLTDPLLGAGILHVRRRVPVPVVEDLGPLTAILISHAHRDHLDVGSLRRLTADCPLIVPRGCGATASRGGASEVIELAEGDRVPVGDIIVEAVHAAHDGRRNPFGQPIPALGYVFEGPVCVYFAGDTDLFAGMSDLAGRVDVALLPVGGSMALSRSLRARRTVSRETPRSAAIASRLALRTGRTRWFPTVHLSGCIWPKRRCTSSGLFRRTGRGFQSLPQRAIWSCGMHGTCGRFWRRI